MNNIQGKQQSPNEIIISIMDKHNLDCFIILSNENRLWFSKFLSSAGIVIVFRDESILMLDGRYYENAISLKNSLLVSKISLMKNAQADLKKLLNLKDARKIGFEAEFVTYYTGKKLNSIDTNFSFFPINTNSIRMKKNSREVNKIKSAISITANVYKDVINYCKIGMTEIEISAFIINSFYSHGAEALAFPPIVASGPNSAFPHHKPTNRKIEPGDVLLIDIGCKFQGYCSDVTRTFFVQTINEKLKEIYEIVKTANEMTIKMISLGINYAQIDAFARNIIAQYNYSVNFIHRTGHGLGIMVHEKPNVADVNKKDKVDYNHVFTVEPGIYLNGIGGVRIEDDIYINSEGNVEVLTSEISKEITVICNN